MLASPELIVIVGIALVVFGPKKIPEIANALGRSIHEFKKGAKEIQSAVHAEVEPSTPPTIVTPAIEAPKPTDPPRE